MRFPCRARRAESAGSRAAEYGIFNETAETERHRPGAPMGAAPAPPRHVGTGSSAKWRRPAPAAMAARNTWERKRGAGRWARSVARRRALTSR